MRVFGTALHTIDPRICKATSFKSFLNTFYTTIDTGANKCEPTSCGITSYTCLNAALVVRIAGFEALCHRPLLSR
jgi:hypothetical protein